MHAIRIKFIFYISLVLVTNSIFSQNITNIDFKKVQLLVENPSSYTDNTLNQSEAILFLGFFGSGEQEVYLCSLLNGKKKIPLIGEDDNEFKAIINRAIKLIDTKDSRKCLIDKKIPNNIQANENYKIRNSESLKKLISKKKTETDTLINEEEAIVFLGYLNNSKDSDFLCSLIKNNSLNDSYESILQSTRNGKVLRALGLIKHDNSVECLINFILKDQKPYDYYLANKSIENATNTLQIREKYIGKLEDSLYKTKGKVRDNIAVLLTSLTSNFIKYSNGISFNIQSTDLKLIYALFWQNFNSRNLDEAILNAELISKRDSKPTIGDFLTGYVHFSLNNFDKAKYYFQKSIESEKNNPYAYYYLGEVFRLNGNLLEARPYYLKHIEFTDSILEKIISTEKIENRSFD